MALLYRRDKPTRRGARGGALRDLAPCHSGGRGMTALVGAAGIDRQRSLMTVIVGCVSQAGAILALRRTCVWRRPCRNLLAVSHRPANAAGRTSGAIPRQA